MKLENPRWALVGRPALAVLVMMGAVGCGGGSSASPAGGTSGAAPMSAADCARNLLASEARIRALEEEREAVQANRARLPADYDRESIDATLGQIEREIETRRAALPSIRMQCDDLASRRSTTVKPPPAAKAVGGE